MLGLVIQFLGMVCNYSAGVLNLLFVGSTTKGIGGIAQMLTGITHFLVIVGEARPVDPVLVLSIGWGFAFFVGWLEKKYAPAE